MTDLPSGTMPFLLTDIEGSTTLRERNRNAMAAVEHYYALGVNRYGLICPVFSGFKSMWSQSVREEQSEAVNQHA